MKKTICLIIALVMMLSCVAHIGAAASGDTSANPWLVWHWTENSGAYLYISDYGIDVPARYDFWFRFDSANNYRISGWLGNSFNIDPANGAIGVGTTNLACSLDNSVWYHVSFDGRSGERTDIFLNGEFIGSVDTVCWALQCCGMVNVMIDNFKMFDADGNLLIDEDFQDSSFDGVNPDTNGQCQTYDAPLISGDLGGHTAHLWDPGVVTQDGEHIVYTCTICGETRTEDYIPSPSEDPEDPPEDPEQPYDGDVTIDYILGKVFTNGRGLVSNEEFRSLALRMWIIQQPYGLDFRSGYRYAVINFEGDVEVSDIDAAEAAAALGLNTKYVEFTPVKAASDGEGGTDVYFSIGWTHDAYVHFDRFNSLSSIENLYLNATLYNVSGRYVFEEIPYLLDDARNYFFSALCGKDVNLDGAVTVKDLLSLKKYVASSDMLINLKATDINGDGFVSVSDIASLKRILSGAEDIPASTWP